MRAIVPSSKNQLIVRGVERERKKEKEKKEEENRSKGAHIYMSLIVNQLL